MKWALWHSIKVVTLWVVFSVFVGGAMFLIARHDGQLIQEHNLDVERATLRPTEAPTPINVRVPAQDTAITYSADNLYAKAGLVVAVDITTDIVTFVDAREISWEFYGVEDWQEGDLLCAIFYDAGTLDPYDDEVVKATYEAHDY